MTAVDVVCHAPKSPRGEEEHVAVTQIVLPRRGVFGVTRGRDKLVVEPSVALFLEAGSTYAVDHPSSHGDRCIVLIFDSGLLDEATTNERPGVARLTPCAELLARNFGTNSSNLDAIEFEEASLWLLRMLVSHPLAPLQHGGHAARERVNEACELLASEPEAPWRLASVAQAVHVSPFHLARQFHAATGTTLGAYLVRQRLSLALDRIVQGETSLAQIAFDTGFASHSHMSARFRSLFGITPSQARRGLTKGLLAEIKRRADIEGQGRTSRR